MPTTIRKIYIDKETLKTLCLVRSYNFISGIIEMSHIVVYVPPNHLWPCPINHTAQGKFILSPEWLVGLKEVHLLVCLRIWIPTVYR